MFEIGQLTRLPLGYVGESGTRTISIDMKAWLDEYPGALIMIQVIRPVDRYKYPAAYTKTGDVIHWTVDGSEVMYAGKGLAQIALYNPDTKQEYKSRVVGTIVAESLDGFNDIMMENTDPASKWVNQVLEAANVAASAQEKAEEVMNSIPHDYMTLSGNVSALSEEVGDLNAEVDTLNQGGLNLNKDFIGEQVNTWLDDHPEATTTVQDKSLTIDKFVVGTLGYVTPEMFGAVGDGVTDDTEAIQEAIDSLTDGGTLLFRDVENYYKLTKSILIGNKKRIRIINGKFDNSENNSQVGFIVSNSDTVIFENCEFYKGQQLILLYTCENIFVDKCTFIETGYCIIQQDGYVSNNVNITNNRAFNTINDFIECNCEINAPSENWVITGNIYKRDLDKITNPATECRFFGATECKNIVISNNLIEGARGDSAIHFEDCGDNVVISNNIIRNCNGYGYIAFMTSRKVLIANNVFENETELDVPFIFATYSDLSTSRQDIDKIVINGNMFNGNKTQTDPLHVYSLNDDIIVDGNIFNDIDVVFKKQALQHLTFRNNIVHCNKFVENMGNSALQNTYIYDALFANNKIYGTTVITANFNGITCKRLKFCNNIFYDDVSIRDAENCIFNDNMIAAGKTLLFDAESYLAKHMYAYNNFVVDGGKIADALSGG